MKLFNPPLTYNLSPIHVKTLHLEVKFCDLAQVEEVRYIAPATF